MADIPDDLVRFILTSIPSIPHLEALLLLRAELNADWSAAEVARRLYTAEGIAIQVLEELKAANFLIALPERPSKYRYGPSLEGQAEMVDRVAHAYSRDLVAVTDLIHRRPSRAVQEFAEAFRIRKE